MWGDNGPDAGLESALNQPALIPELSDAEGLESGRIVAAPVGHRDLPYGWDTFMENVLVSCLGYVSCSFFFLCCCSCCQCCFASLWCPLLSYFR